MSCRFCAINHTIFSWNIRCRFVKPNFRWPAQKEAFTDNSIYNGIRLLDVSYQENREADGEAMALDPSMCVLVVDDQAVMVRIIQGLLRQLGVVNADAARNGRAALEKLRAKRYDVVISDWHMDHMNGYDLLCEIRSDEQLKDTPFIMVTGDGKKENVVAAKKAGVDNYIVKPFNSETLKSKIEAIFTTRSPVVPELQGVTCPAVLTYA